MSFDVHVYIHSEPVTPDPLVADVLTALRDLQTQVAAIRTKEDQLMATGQELLDAVTAEKTVEDSVIALLTGFEAQVTAASGNQAAVDQAVTELLANKDALVAAVVAGTPVAAPATPPVDVPPVDVPPVVETPVADVPVVETPVV